MQLKVLYQYSVLSKSYSETKKLLAKMLYDIEASHQIFQNKTKMFMYIEIKVFLCENEEAMRRRKIP